MNKFLKFISDVAECFKRLIAYRPKVEFEKMLDGYTGFLCIDENGEPLVAMHWEHRFNHMVGRYNNIFKVQMPNITPHVCRHTYTHLGLEDAAEELKRMQ